MLCRTSPEHTTRHNGGQGGPEEVRWSDDGSSEGGLSPSSGVTATDCNAVLRSESDNFLMTEKVFRLFYFILFFNFFLIMASFEKKFINY